MASIRVEYVGFTVSEATREYALRVRLPGGELRAFTLAIAHKAFLDHRVRYQDGPDICYLKLQRELLAYTDGLPSPHLDVTDAELEEYRVAHEPKSRQRRP